LASLNHSSLIICRAVRSKNLTDDDDWLATLLSGLLSKAVRLYATRQIESAIVLITNGMPSRDI
jgi:hypothetical protein